MDISISYPNWGSVNAPSPLLDFLRRCDDLYIISYFAINRVFRYPVKPQYFYLCPACNKRKILSRTYEEYFICEHCGVDSQMRPQPQFRMGKAKIDCVDDDFPGLVLKQMYDNHVNYFGEHPPEGYHTLEWRFACKPQRKLFESGENEDFGKPPMCVSQFLSGDNITATSQAMAICKSAILTPYLWDDLFDWRYFLTKDKINETPILPLYDMVAKLQKQERPRRQFKVAPLDMGVLGYGNPGYGEDQQDG